MKKEKPDAYDWAAYYKAAYEKEKKKNTVLAGKLADAEAKETDLAQRLARIQGSIFWKLSTPVRKGYHALTGGKRVKTTDIRDVEAVEAVRRYEQEVYAQRHPYLRCIVGEKTDDPEINIDGWQRIDWEDADLTLLLYGQGILDAQTKPKIKSWFKNKSYLFAYADEDYYWRTLSNRMCPWYKPDWSPDTLLSFCYIGHMLIMKRSLCNGLLEQERYQNGTAADFYDLCLRLEEEAARLQCGIGHIEEVLFHNRYEPEKDNAVSGSQESLKADNAMPGSQAKPETDVLQQVELQLTEALEQGYDMMGCSAAFCSVREAALQRRGIRAHLEAGAEPDIYHVVYDAAGDGQEAMISVVIPSKDHPEVLEKCLSSFQEKTDYQNYEWIVVDNGSTDENRKRVEALQQTYGFCYLYEPMEFNFSAMCNLGARHAKGSYILLLNDDIEIIEKDWLRVMAGQAAQPNVGAVGAKLWYAGTEVIQHAGITNMEVGPSHKLTSLLDDVNYYYGHNRVTYDMIGVTAACLLVDAAKYREVGGMDESMKIAYNDVDFCFKLLEAGYYNVLRNDAVLYHNESLSRGIDSEEDSKWLRLLSEKERLYQKHPHMQGRDAFYHKNLVDDELEYTCNYKADCNQRMKMVDIFPGDADCLAGAVQGVLQLTVDSIGQQRKIHVEEEELLVVTGWGYLPGADNALYEKTLLLQKEDGALYTAVPYLWLRPDVEKVLTDEVNISLSGFVLRFPKEKLPCGKWKIGMLAEHAVSRRKFLAWSDVEMTVTE